MRLVRVFKPGVYDLLAITDAQGRCFLDELIEEEENEGQRASDSEEMLDWLKTMTRDGPGHFKPRSERFHDSTCAEFKAGRYRIGWFYDPRPSTQGRIVLTHLFFKTTRRTPRPEIDRAESLERKYIAAKQAGQLMIDERKLLR